MSVLLVMVVMLLLMLMRMRVEGVVVSDGGREGRGVSSWRRLSLSLLLLSSMLLLLLLLKEHLMLHLLEDLLLELGGQRVVRVGAKSVGGCCVCSCSG